MLTVTQSAADRIQQISEMSDQGAFLRLSVKGGGCSGFQYDFSMTDQIEYSDTVIEEGKIKVLIDPASEMFLIGCELDYTQDMFSSVFRVNNPNATANCGCGESFAV